MRQPRTCCTGEDVLRLAVWSPEGGGVLRPDIMSAAAVAARQRYDFPLAERLARAALAAGPISRPACCWRRCADSRAVPRKPSSSCGHASLPRSLIPNGRCCPQPGSASSTGGLSAPDAARTPALATAVPARAALIARELEIARLAAAGLANKEIAERLCLSHRTVENKLHAAYDTQSNHHSAGTVADTAAVKSRVPSWS